MLKSSACLQIDSQRFSRSSCNRFHTRPSLPAKGISVNMILEFASIIVVLIFACLTLPNQPCRHLLLPDVVVLHVCTIRTSCWSSGFKAFRGNQRRERGWDFAIPDFPAAPS